MDLVTFKYIVGTLQTCSNTIDNLYKYKIDLIDFTDDYHKVIHTLIGCIYGKEGLDTFTWWCYEKEWGKRNDLTMTDKDGNELCTTIDKLHEYLEQNSTNDYTISIPKQSTGSTLDPTFEELLNNITKNYKE